MFKKELIGRTWGSLTEAIKNALLSNASPVSGIDSNRVLSGPCIVDFDGNLSVDGNVIDNEIVIDDNAVLYNPIA